MTASSRTTLLLVIGLLTACGSQPFQARDIVILVMDTTRADHLGVYGSPRPISPRLDAFARESEVYENAWSTSSWTLPSHASLLTGKYPTSHGAHMRPDRDADSLGENPAHLNAEATTLAELLAARGYHTAAFAGAGWLAPEFGLLQGYAVQDAENLRDIPAEEITDRASAWLDRVPAGEPLHLLVNYFDAHGPYEPPEAFNIFPAGKQPVSKPVTPEEITTLPAEELEARFATAMAPVIDRYDGEIHYMDHHLGRLLDKLRELGRYRDALILIVADHGEGFWEKGAIGHGAWLYEPLIHIPFLVHHPGGRGAGARVDTLVSLVDVLPIVADATGLVLPADIHGVPVGSRRLVLAEEVPSALFRKPTPDGRRNRLDRELLAGIAWPFKLILNLPGGPELYRLDLDPAERTDLADGTAELALKERILASFAALAPPPESSEPPRPMSPGSRERLKALGYLE